MPQRFPKSHISMTNRMVRAVIAVLIFVLMAAGLIAQSWLWAVPAAILMLTAIFGFCPVAGFLKDKFSK